ncbi:hypothetical protein I553_8870 [Mycobacterium xenopi 4042]|uniref:Uncharacterized protein n=1 Tax=Mycobacterium xenopi 4042 TaxID=1299334 RepID=X8CLY0_MYCXE|nr:hypothetical protein I553_8870 [Mycobacterium xenopi 4042]
MAPAAGTGRRDHRVGGLVLILLSCTLVGPTTPYPGSAALLPVLAPPW